MVIMHAGNMQSLKQLSNLAFDAHFGFSPEAEAVYTCHDIHIRVTITCIADAWYPTVFALGAVKVSAILPMPFIAFSKS